MAAVQAWQVFARYVLNDSPSWTEPVALLCMSTTMMFGAAAGVHASRHFGFFILVETAAPRMRRVLLLIAQFIAAAIGVMFAVWGGQMLIDAWDYPIAGAPLPQGVVFAPLCLGGALIAVFAVEQMFRKDAIELPAAELPPPNPPPQAGEGRKRAGPPSSSSSPFAGEHGESLSPNPPPLAGEGREGA